MSPTFASLSVRNYRWWFSGALVSNIGTWMGRVAQDWLVLTTLTDHDSTALGVVTGLQFLPFLLLAPWTGAIADRFPKRRILLLTQTLLLATSVVFGLVVVTGVAQLWMVYVLAFAQGIITAVDNPARQSFVSEVVPTAQLPNAVALNSASFNIGRLVGPGIAGLLIAAIDTGPVFFVNSASFLFVIVALAVLDPRELHPSPLARGRGKVREGLRYVAGRPDIKLVLFLVFMLGTFGMNFQLTTALMATEAFGKGAGEYGLLGSIMAIGSLAAALLAARRGKPRLKVLIRALIGFTVASAAAALAPTYLTFALALIPTGLASLTALTTANSLVQTRVAPEVRGRVMALYMAIFMGGTPLGAPVIGWIGEVWGPRWTIGIGSLATGLSLIVVAIWLARHRHLKVSLTSERPPWVSVTADPVIELTQPILEPTR